MIYHQVRVLFKPEIPEDERQGAIERLRKMGREIDVVQSWSVGRDIGGEFEYGAVYALPDIDAYETYMNAPVHLETDAAGLPLVANFVSFDLTDDEDPEIAKKIADVHERRYRNRPEILGLVEDLDEYTGSGVPADSPAAT
jgi:Stress responsive A/B Barrel Domain